MAEAPDPPASSASSPRAAGTGMQKKVAGLPAWMWGAGAVVLVGAYLYLRHSSASSAGSSQQKPSGGRPVAFVGGGSPTGLSMEQFLLILEDLQGHKSKGRGHGRHGGPHHHHHHDHDGDHDRHRRHPRPDPGGRNRKAHR